MRGQRVSLGLFRFVADHRLLETERRARCLEDEENGIGHFGADPVAADQGDRLHPFFSGGRIILTFLIAVGVASSITKSARRPRHRSPLRGIRPKRSIRWPAICMSS